MAVVVSLIGPPPWGFRVRGGRDFRGPLTITKVHEDSKAALVDLRAGDMIVEVNGDPTAAMLNMEAQRKIRNSSSHLKLLIDRPSVPYQSCPGCRFKPGFLLRQDLEADDKGGQRTPPKSLTAQPIRSPLPTMSTSSTSDKPCPVITQPMKSSVPRSASAPSILKKRDKKTTGLQTNRFQRHTFSPPERLYGQRQAKPVHQALPPADTTKPSLVSKTTSANMSSTPVTPRNSSEMPMWKYPTLETEVYKRIQQKKVTFATPKQSRTFYLLQEGLEAPNTRNPSLSRPPLQNSIATSSQRFRSCERCGNLIVTQVVRLAEGRHRHVDCYSCEECGLNLLNRGHFWVCGRHAWQRHQRAAERAVRATAKSERKQ